MQCLKLAEKRLIFALPEYAAQLAKNGGQMPEFINPPLCCAVGWTKGLRSLGKPVSGLRVFSLCVAQGFVALNQPRGMSQQGARKSRTLNAGLRIRSV